MQPVGGGQAAQGGPVLNPGYGGLAVMQPGAAKGQQIIGWRQVIPASLAFGVRSIFRCRPMYHFLGQSSFELSRT